MKENDRLLLLGAHFQPSNETKLRMFIVEKLYISYGSSKRISHSYSAAGANTQICNFRDVTQNVQKNEKRIKRNHVCDTHTRSIKFNYNNCRKNNIHEGK